MDRVCGKCRYFRVAAERDDESTGRCRLEKIIGVFRDTMRACPSFSVLGDPNPPIVDGTRTRRAVRSRGPGLPFVANEVSPRALSELLQTLDPDSLHQALSAAFRDLIQLREVDLGRAWVGNFVLLPAGGELKPKEMELEQFFHKLVMIRDNLRVLEQKINSHKQLHDSERIDLQRRVSLCHTALIRLGTGWLPRPTHVPVQAIIDDLVTRSEFETLALPGPPLGDRWAGGTVRYGRAPDLVEEPMEVFYLRLVVLRDRLMSLEALVSAHAHISADEADGIGGYVRRCYGTLTSFNVLFHKRSDYFSSRR